MITVSIFSLLFEFYIQNTKVMSSNYSKILDVVSLEDFEQVNKRLGELQNRLLEYHGDVDFSENPKRSPGTSVEQWREFCAQMASIAIRRDPRDEEEIIRYWSAAIKRI